LYSQAIRGENNDSIHLYNTVTGTGVNRRDLPHKPIHCILKVFW